MAHTRRNFRRKESLLKSFSLTTWLIITNVILFFIFGAFLALEPESIDNIAIQPSTILAGQTIWTIFTSMFMHAGGLHLFVNMFSLFFLGSLCERIVGRKRFLWLYLVSGIFGGLAFVLFAYLGGFFPKGDFLFGGLDDFAVGASGALFGLLGLLAVLIPRQKVFLIVGPLIVIILQFVLGEFLSGSIVSFLNIALSFLIFLMIVVMFSPDERYRRLSLPMEMPLWVAPIVAIVPLVFISYFVKLPIGNTAHFGGLVAGLIYGFYLRRKYKRKVRLLERMFR